MSQGVFRESKRVFRNKFEAKIAGQLTSLNHSYGYESKKISYLVPEKVHTYLVDFILENGILIETKGRFTLKDRQKHLFIRESNPHLDIRFVFMNSKSKICKGSKTTYGDWCEKNGFKYADKEIPEDWVN